MVNLFVVLVRNVTLVKVNFLETFELYTMVLAMWPQPRIIELLILELVIKTEGHWSVELSKKLPVALILLLAVIELNIIDELEIVEVFVLREEEIKEALEKVVVLAVKNLFLIIVLLKERSEEPLIRIVGIFLGGIIVELTGRGIRSIGNIR